MSGRDLQRILTAHLLEQGGQLQAMTALNRALSPAAHSIPQHDAMHLRGAGECAIRPIDSSRIVTPLCFSRE